MEKNEEIINSIRGIFIETINMYCDKHKHFFTEMDSVYRCMRTLKITDMLFSKTKDHICKIWYCGKN